MRRAARVDANQQEIVDGLRKLGISVEIIEEPLDCLIWHRGEYALLEIKTPGGRLTKAQVEFIQRWPGRIHIAESLTEAIELILGKEVMA